MERGVQIVCDVPHVAAYLVKKKVPLFASGILRDIQRENNLQYRIEMNTIDLLYIDLFCGAGGTSTGVESARINGEQCAKVIACVNHDANAIASHAANHPEAMHFTEDIRTLELSPLVTHVQRMKQLYPEARLVLWASLECTNFSKAKGGQPRDADSRTLAEHLFRYIESLNPDYIQIENVEEFMSWGPMDENGRPISMNKGEDYTRWVHNVKSYGYNFDHRIMNAADYGAYTSRKRFFGIFAKNELPIVFPEPTHCKEGKQDMFGSLAKWKPVKDVLDFEDEGTSIFTRKKPLSEKTLERIYAGLIKFVAGGKDKWLLKYNSINGKTGKHIPPGIDEPCPTISCQGRLGIVNAQFLSRYNTCRPQDTCKSVEAPCGVLTTNNRFAKVDCHFLSKYFSGHPESKNIPIDGPAHTVKCKDNHALVGAKFLAAYYGNGDNVSQVDKPCPTVPTKDRFNYVNPKFLCSYNFNDAGKDIDAPCPTLLTKDRLSLVSPFFMNYYSGGGQHSDVNQPSPAILANPKQRLVSCQFMDQQFGQSKPTGLNRPLGALTSNPKYNLVSCRPWVMNINFGNIGSQIDDPAPVITANRKWHYLMNPQFMSAGGNIENPCFTLIARMDKMPPYLVCTQEGDFLIRVYESDSPMTRKIKEFMALYGIVDILMRMLKIPELKQIMGFPKDYRLIGTQAEQKKFIGNAVEVTMARVLCEAVGRKLRELRKVAA
jgi:DNA (cytosine-5)-methyltransferase 1